MNASKPATVENWLSEAIDRFTEAGIKTARLDALLLLELVSKQDRTWLIAHPHEALTDEQNTQMHTLVSRRAKREPLAYIVGTREFYGRTFAVNNKVLIPRPESESVIHLVKKHVPDGSKVIDVGTGSGCLAITMKLERPDLVVLGTDISEPAIQVARQNAEKLSADVDFRVNNLLNNLAEHFDVIVANLPYVDMLRELEPELKYEPMGALFTEKEGLAMYERLFEQIPSHLTGHGIVIIESEPEQQQRISRFATHAGLEFLTSEGFAMAFVSNND